VVSEESQESIPAYFSSDALVCHLNAIDCRRIKATKTFPGVGAVFKMPKDSSPEGERILVLNGINDPGNLGTLMRTALWFGMTSVILDSKTADPYNEKTVRASAGAIAGLNLHATDDLVAKLKSLQQKGFTLMAASLDGQEPTKAPGEPYALILGSEAHGIEDAVLSLCEKRICISGGETMESLNVTVAAGILLYWLTSTKASL
jgi:TrmH family RNA methyltransferase